MGVAQPEQIDGSPVDEVADRVVHHRPAPAPGRVFRGPDRPDQRAGVLGEDSVRFGVIAPSIPVQDVHALGAERLVGLQRGIG